MSPIQKILFGSPGTGKSFSIRKIAEKELKLQWDQQTQSLQNTVKTVFHPEYTYSDFVGKLLPQTTRSGSVTYKFHAGHFLQSLGLAYQKIISNSPDINVLLVIDELNRGNASAIFGSIFQLLDRGKDDWSTYEVNFSEVEIVELLKIMGYQIKLYDDNVFVKYENKFYEINDFYEAVIGDETPFGNGRILRIMENLKKCKIAIPDNLSIIATINTSDESIYYLDTAFKRRWDWEYVDVPNSRSYDNIPEEIKNISVVIGNKTFLWSDLVIKLNEFIKSKHNFVRKIEDKQIGWWFLKADKNNVITESVIKNKLMFYLWDSVFAKDKTPLEKELNEKLITYADFVNLTTEFIVKLSPNMVSSEEVEQDLGF